MSRLMWSVVVLSAVLVAVWAKKEEVDEVSLLQRRPYKPLPQPTSCRELGKCCQGKDNSCRIKLGGKQNEEEPASNGLIASLHNSTNACFCDSACIALGDCCKDYEEVCAPVDCAVTDTWDEWGECDAKCGSGIKQRTRKVLQMPLNGGKPCPTTVEKVPCEGINCKQARASYLRLRDTAHIISAKYAPWRVSSEYHPRRGIRKNLFDHYSANITERPSYCTVFELTQVSHGCNESGPSLVKLGFDEQDITFFSTKMVKGGQVCVECQDTAMKNELGGRCSGEGVSNKETRWSITAGCRGKWKMVSKKDQCTCGPHDGMPGEAKGNPSFLFV